MRSTQKIIEAIATMHMFKSKYDKEATPRRPLKALRYDFALAIQALEKQVAKQVKLYIGTDMCCPACGKRLHNYEGIRNPYCKFCGQKLER